MSKTLFSAKRVQSGFTLIEILLVMALLAALATIVLIAINPAQKFKQQRDTQRTTDVANIAGAVQQYYVDHKGTFPGGIPVAPAAAKLISSTEVDLCSFLVPNYLVAMPKDPNNTSTPCTGTWSTGYSIVKESSTSDRVIVSATSEVTPATPISVTR